MTKEEYIRNLSRIEQLNRSIPKRLNAQLDLRYMDCDPGERGGDGKKARQPWAEFRFDKKDEFLNPYGAVHGGIVTAVADTAVGTALVGLRMKAVVTVDINVSFLRSLEGKSYRVRVEFTHIGAKLASANVKIFDIGSDDLCATVMTTFMVLSDRVPGLRI